MIRYANLMRESDFALAPAGKEMSSFTRVFDWKFRWDFKISNAEMKSIFQLCFLRFYQGCVNCCFAREFEPWKVDTGGVFRTVLEWSNAISEAEDLFNSLHVVWECHCKVKRWNALKNLGCAGVLFQFGSFWVTHLNIKKSGILHPQCSIHRPSGSLPHRCG